jgi:hypothetical protein
MQICKVVYPRGQDWLAFKCINLIRFVRLIKVKRTLSPYLVSPWAHLSSVVGVYMLSAHCLACLLFFVGRWQLLNLERGGPNDFTGAGAAQHDACKLVCCSNAEGQDVC